MDLIITVVMKQFHATVPTLADQIWGTTNIFYSKLAIPRVLKCQGPKKLALQLGNNWNQLSNSPFTLLDRKVYRARMHKLQRTSVISLSAGVCRCHFKLWCTHNDARCAIYFRDVCNLWSTFILGWTRSKVDDAQQWKDSIHQHQGLPWSFRWCTATHSGRPRGTLTNCLSFVIVRCLWLSCLC